MDSNFKIGIVEVENNDKRLFNLDKAILSNLDFTSFDSLESIEFEIKNNNIDFGIIELSSIGELNEELVVAALTERNNNFYKLYIKHNKVDKSKDLRLTEKGDIGVESRIVMKIVENLRPDCKVDLYDSSNLELLLLKDAVILNVVLANNEFEIFELHPSEFTPQAGKGALAMICKKDNLTLRKTLTSFHNPEVSLCTNVERKIEKELQQLAITESRVYCEKDLNNNFHVYTSFLGGNDNLKSYKYSQSTNYQLAEKVIEIIKNN